MHNSFTAHPRSVGQGYWRHFGFAMQVAGRAILIGLIAALHAVFPFLCQTTASERLFKLADEVRTGRVRR